MLSTLLLLLAVPATTPHPACIFPDGTTIRLELADTEAGRIEGLMFRDFLAEDAGMLFIFEREGLWPFWMKNTFIPLDMIWLDSNGVIVDIRANVQPCRLDPCPSYWPRSAARAMLEINAGLAAKHGLKSGNRLGFRQVVGYPE